MPNNFPGTDHKIIKYMHIKILSKHTWTSSVTYDDIIDI